MKRRFPYFSLLQPTLPRFKSHLRITSVDLDSELQEKLMAAVYAAEKMIGQVIAISRFEYTTKFQPVITITETPLVEINSVMVDGTETSEYTLKGRRIKFAPEVSGSTVTVTYTAGREFVEFDIQAAILLHAASLFNNPADSVENLPKASTNLLRPYRHWELEDDEDGEQD